MNEIINVFKILSDETRLRMLMILEIKELVFVFDQRRDKYVFYKINEESTLLNKTLENIKNLYNESQVFIDDEKKLNEKNLRTSKCFTY